MRFRLFAIPVALAAAGCASTGYYGAAYLTAGSVSLKETTETVEECAANVRVALSRPDAMSLGQVTQYGDIKPPEGVIGTCAGPDRIYFITQTEIQKGPLIQYER